MSVRLPEIRKDKVLSTQKHLERCLNLPLPMESSEDFKISTNFDRQRAELAIQELHQIKAIHRELCKLILLPDRHIKILVEKSQFMDRVIDEIDIYLFEYKDILKEEVKVSLSKIIKTLKVGSLAYSGLYLLMKSVLEKSPFEQVKKYAGGVNSILRCVEYAILLNPQEISEILELDQIKLIASKTMEYQFLSEADLKAKGISKSKCRKILAYIQSAKSDALTILKKLESVDKSFQQQGIQIEVDGETIYLSPDSAEGKALDRIANPIPSEEWVVLVEKGQEVDVSGALERLKKRGYKIKV